MPNRNAKTSTTKPVIMFNYSDFDQNWLPEGPPSQRASSMRDPKTGQARTAMTPKSTPRILSRKNYYGK